MIGLYLNLTVNLQVELGTVTLTEHYDEGFHPAYM